MVSTPRFRRRREPRQRRQRILEFRDLQSSCRIDRYCAGLLCRFIVQVFGRRHDGRRLALRRPASKKRQGTKSRDVGERLGSEGYGDLMLAPRSLAGATLGRGDLHAWTQGGRERENAVSAGAWSVSTGAGCIDRGESSRERSPPAWSQRNGTGKGRRSEEVWLMTCRLCLVSGATSAGGRMRTPRSRSCGRRNAGMGRETGVAHLARYPTAVVGRRQAG